ncbi:hypothetical protein DFH08DRAFT_793749 [Mycena albidolilacea]|uniref:BTB domain-containing protein n=1 Tax=Mycena albidolilacea TaxID=1033008 RepID=A0AAD6Z201_9AGAR|nr:hypothetical protein DFH08DRAFT_793749 [Mycena albidolilacea]
MTDSTDEKNLKQVDGLWFDGDLVILRAGNHIFRVFTTVLKERSSVFASMFAFPQPPTPESETIGGVPVVNMHDDPAQLEFFLKAMFDPTFFLPPPAKTELDVVLGVLRLSNKYDVHFLCRRALEHLGTVHCMRLKDYHPDDSIATYDHLSDGSLIDGYLKTIKILVEVGALWMLPDAYFALYPVDLLGLIRAASWDGLGDSEKANCLRVFSHKVRMQPACALLEFLSAAETSCKVPNNCNRARQEAIRDHAWSSNLDIVDAWSEYGWAYLAEGLCELCLQEARDVYEQAKQNFWDDLPALFDLPDWATLEQLREKFLGPVVEENS